MKKFVEKKQRKRTLKENNQEKGNYDIITLVRRRKQNERKLDK